MKIMMYGFLRYGAWETFFVIFDYFLPFYPPNNLGNFHFEKTKKMPGDIIILHKCIINDNHMMYGSWDMKCDRHNFLSFWVFFYFFGTFTPIITQKIQIKKKKEKKTTEYHHFTQVYQKSWSSPILFLRYCAWQM